MPKEWPDQPRFLEVLRTMRSASEASIAELVALAKKDAKSYYKHAAAILVKQCQMRKPRDRVPIVFVMNKLASDKDDHESAKLYAGRFAPDIVACVESALSCPPKHMHGPEEGDRSMGEAASLPALDRASRRSRG